MDDNQPKPRRWFRFSVRTMFVVVTVVCAWLGYHTNWIGERPRAKATIEIREFPVIFAGESDTPPGHGGLPWSLRILGEQPVCCICVSYKRLDELRRLFPESFVMYKDAERPAIPNNDNP